MSRWLRSLGAQIYSLVLRSGSPMLPFGEASCSALAWGWPRKSTARMERPSAHLANKESWSAHSRSHPRLLVFSTTQMAPSTTLHVSHRSGPGSCCGLAVSCGLGSHFLDETTSWSTRHASIAARSPIDLT